MTLLLASLSFASTSDLVDQHLAGVDASIGTIGSTYHAIEARLERGYSETQVAAALAWTRAHVSDWSSLPADQALDAGLAATGAVTPSPVVVAQPTPPPPATASRAPASAGPGTSFGFGIGSGSIVHATYGVGLGRAPT